MGIDYLIIVLALIAFLGFLSLSFIYLPFNKAKALILKYYKFIKKQISSPDSKKARSEPSLRNTGLDTLQLGQKSSKKSALPKRDASTEHNLHSQLTVLYVMADPSELYNGYRLWQTLIDQGLIYGESKIFHAYGKDKARQILFSVAGAIEPGYFEIDNIASIRLPGLCLFMHNDAAPNPVETFEYMLSIAQKIAQQLGGKVYDDKRQILSEKTIRMYQSRLNRLVHDK
jgi:cell division protein ZipA